MFEKKVVLITGAASGIGRDTAVAFAEKGATVVVSDVQKEGLDETADLIQKDGGEVTAIITDVSKEEEVKSMIDKIVEKYGRLDAACNNAGVGGVSAATADYTSEQWDHVLNINLKGQWLCMKYQIPVMLQNKGGSIVNVASILGTVGFANAPAYVASKHGLVGLTKAAALEYSAKGIRVNAIAPAFIETPMLEQAGLTTDPEMKKMLVGLHPIGRLGKPREVADAIVWMASEEASFVTGHTLLVDGGYISQ
jgi:NAD(P)-dependent dehydrogenase (short-subunit alcohol dehydrogenase family)